MGRKRRVGEDATAEDADETILVTSEAHALATYMNRSVAAEDAAASRFAPSKDTEGGTHGTDAFMSSRYIVYLPVKKGTRPCCSTSRHEIIIQHAVLTSIAKVGLQVWRGSFLLADYILSKLDELRESSVALLEFGGGTGIIGTILRLCQLGSVSYITDYSEEIVSLASRNMISMDTSSCAPQARVLDWSSDVNPRHQVGLGDSSKDRVGERPYNWTKADTILLSSPDTPLLCLAADLVYDDTLTCQFFAKAAAVMRVGEHMWLSIEKRYNFSLEETDLVANGYQTFLDHMVILSRANPDAPLTEISATIPKYSYPCHATELHDDLYKKKSSYENGGQAGVEIDTAATAEYNTKLKSGYISDGYDHNSSEKKRVVFFVGHKIPIDFPQRVHDYDRMKDLELWDIQLQHAFLKAGAVIQQIPTKIPN